MRAAVPGLENTFMAGVYRPLNKHFADFTWYIRGSLEYRNKYCALFRGGFNTDVMDNSNMARNYVDSFHRYSFVIEINMRTYISPSEIIYDKT